jgi:hypothetical protein
MLSGEGRMGREWGGEQPLHPIPHVNCSCWLLVIGQAVSCVSRFLALSAPDPLG